jgi:hypothetical protein
VRPTLAGEQDGQGDAHKNGAIENGERTALLHTIDAAPGAGENGREDFNQGPQGNHQIKDIVEDQNLPLQAAGDFGFELYPVSR